VHARRGHQLTGASDGCRNRLYSSRYSNRFRPTEPLQILLAGRVVSRPDGAGRRVIRGLRVTSANSLTSIADINGTRLRHTRLGPADGPPMVRTMLDVR
jgi:hypothetical protein